METKPPSRKSFEEFAVDTSNSLLTSDESERVWIESGLNDQWLNTLLLRFSQSNSQKIFSEKEIRRGQPEFPLI